MKLINQSLMSFPHAIQKLQQQVTSLQERLMNMEKVLLRVLEAVEG